MPRDSGRNTLRESIASIAARLMAEDGIEDYAHAKRKAARQVGATDARQMPTNDQIDTALTIYRGLFQQDHPEQLRELRELALGVMRELSAFNPHLTGSVLHGNAGRHATVQLQLFCENLKQVEHYLLGTGVPLRTAETGLLAGELPVVTTVRGVERWGWGCNREVR